MWKGQKQCCVRTQPRTEEIHLIIVKRCAASSFTGSPALMVDVVKRLLRCIELCALNARSLSSLCRLTLRRTAVQQGRHLSCQRGHTGWDGLLLTAPPLAFL